MNIIRYLETFFPAIDYFPKGFFFYWHQKNLMNKDLKNNIDSYPVLMTCARVEFNISS